ncbi:MAG: thioredoxin domain-containing protein [Woeseiaceae bacterium]|nr:thioredoxin domain-containing protein [Woeseiaceae bacterium]
MPNRLAKETSPYLLQHADNPVDWYPWGEAAFAAAQDAGKPVLLSVGYSACHWCHVMAHESFEDEQTAELMNRLYVNIKVDREERPDIDRIYQLAHQLLTQRGGGWPLTMFLDAETRRPFFGGTYFPNERRHGMPAFAEVLESVARYHKEHGSDIDDQGRRLDDIFRQLAPAAATATMLDDRPLDAVRERLARDFDGDFGGFGSAPKFPHPATIDRLLRHWQATAKDAEPDVDALFMASLTLTRMAEGGLYDHVGGGFCRYSVDRYWQIPHFEKMLYDNGPLLASYAQAALATGEALFAKTAAETAGWLLADMQSPDGGFYAARDADSEGEEGKYYVWTPDVVRGLLEEGEYDVFARRFGLDREANFEGHWHLTVRQSINDLASEFSRPVEDVEAMLDAARTKLLAARAERVPPLRDEKQLTAWNALAIRGLAIAARALGRDDLADAAVAACDFVREKLYVKGRLLASYKDGRARFPAYLDDHAFLIDAILELNQVRWDTGRLGFAIELAELLLTHFEDPDAGGFFFTADDHEALIHRSKTLADEAMPSGNGVAALALQRLGHLLGEQRYVDAAERTLRAAWQAIKEYPHGHVTLLSALEEYLEPPELLILRGPLAEIDRWRADAQKIYAPRRLVFAIDEAASDLPGLLAERKPLAGESVAYRCIGTHCELPVGSWEALPRQLSAVMPGQEDESDA